MMELRPLADLIQVPIDPEAPEAARRQVNAWAGLFDPDALDLRRAILHPLLARYGVSDKDRRPVDHSLAWGTALEVALRLVPHDLDKESFARIDALGVSLRVFQGVRERRGRGDSALAESLREVSQALLEESSPRWIIDEWAQLCNVLVLDEPWTKAETRVVAETQPLHVAFVTIANVASNLDPWYQETAAIYGALQWMARDASSAVGSHDSRVVGRVSNLVASGLETRSPEIREALLDEVQAMDAYALALASAKASAPENVHADIELYISTTLDFAGKVYAHLEAAGLL